MCVVSTHVLLYCDNNITCVLLVSQTRVISVLLIVITKHLFFLHMFYYNVSLHSSNRSFRHNCYEAFMYMYIKAIFSTWFILPDKNTLNFIWGYKFFLRTLRWISLFNIQSVASINPSIHPSFHVYIHPFIPYISIRTGWY